MKIAVIGGGTAGFIAAVHLTKAYPQFELFHVFNSGIPPIGVGEGTMAGFPRWLRAATGLTEPELEERCDITRKYGIKYENWGEAHAHFMHHFHPPGRSYAYHFSADKIVDLLKNYVSAHQIDKEVVDLQSDGTAVRIAFKQGSPLDVDIAIDATGFPHSLDDTHVRLALIPTNAALIRRCPAQASRPVTVTAGDQVLSYSTATRSVARPHGWVFVIPLTSRTTYGYVHNQTINSVAEVARDFDVFLESENIAPHDQERYLPFPNFSRRTYFDGALFRIGNAASFLEPLEATAIGFTLKQVLTFSHWPLRYCSHINGRGELLQNNIRILNKYLLNEAHKLALFVGWHYSMGSRFHSPFWEFARANYASEVAKVPQHLGATFEGAIQSGAKYPDPINRFREFCESPVNGKQSRGVFGQWSGLSFAENGYGLGRLS